MQFIIPVATFLAGIFAQKFVDFIYDWGKHQLKVRLTRRQVQNHQAEAAVNLNIMSLGTGIPEFDPENPSDISVKNINFRLAFPEEQRQQLSQHDQAAFAQVDQIAPNFKSQLTYFYPDEAELNTQIQAAKRVVAENYLKQHEGFYFNGLKYGVFRTSGFKRTNDLQERPLIEMQLYLTDYFTHSVMQQLAQQLKLSDRTFTIAELNDHYYPFRTSLGVSVVVYLPGTDEVILTQRSVNAAYTNEEPWIYVSVTESISETDIDPQSHEISLVDAVKRGLNEELGIRDNLYSVDAIHFYDIFLEKNFFQDNVVASVTLYDHVTWNEIQALQGRDQQMEIDSAYTIKRSELKPYITQHQEHMRAQTIYSLQSFLNHNF